MIVGIGIIRIRKAHGNRTARKKGHPRNRMIKPASRSSSDTRDKNSSAPSTPSISVAIATTIRGKPLQDGDGSILFNSLQFLQTTNAAKAGTKIPCEKFGSLIHWENRRARIVP